MEKICKSVDEQILNFQHTHLRDVIICVIMKGTDISMQGGVTH